MKKFFLFLIRAYQKILSPCLGTNCRFVPSCSDYAIGSIERRGTWPGLVRAAQRLLKCHPFHAGGFDPVE